MSTITLSSARPVTRTRVRPASKGGQVRLTRRGRAVVFVLGLVAAFALGILLASGSIASSEGGGEAAVEVVTVAPGDTLWDIASAAAADRGDEDVRSMMDRIEELNSLESSMVFAGQDLQVPTD